MSRSKSKRRRKSKKRKHRSTRVPAPNRPSASRQERALLGSIKRRWQQVVAVSASRSIAAFVKRGWKYVCGLAAFCTIAGFVIAILWPRLHVRPGQATVPTNPFRTYFVLRNDGYLCSITDIDIACRVRKLRFKGLSAPTLAGPSFRGFDKKIAELRPTESHSVQFDRVIGIRGDAPIANADIEVIVTYSHLLRPWGRPETRYRFRIVGNDKGELEWAPVAVSM